MRFWLTILFLALVLGSSAWAYPNTKEEYLQEIREEVFYPCYREQMKILGTSGLITMRALHLGNKQLGGAPFDVAIREQILLNQVVGKKIEGRLKIYFGALRQCIKAYQKDRTDKFTETLRGVE